MNKGLQLILLIAAIVLMAKFMEPPGPRTASAVGNYDAVQPVVKLPEVYRGPSSCTTTSWKGPYKWDGMTHSTVCK